MKINRLALRGFIGIKKGLDLDDVELDFSKIGGLVAFDGPNGHGKTTILDNLHPYRTLASRQRSLKQHVFLRDSFKELEFEFNGNLYRSVTKIDAQSERQEAFIYVNGGAESETGGKVSEYDRFISGLFGSSSLFFNSVFCAQNSDKMTDLTTGELKKLFSEFLRLDQLERHEATSKHCVSILNGRLSGIDRELDYVQKRMQPNADAALRLETEQQELTRIKDQRDESKARISRIVYELETARAAAEKARIASGKLETLETDSRQLLAAIQRVEHDAGEKDGVFRDKLCALSIEATGPERLLAQTEGINAAARSRDETVKLIDETGRQIEQEAEKVNRFLVRINELQARDAEISKQFDDEKARLEKKLAEVDKKIAENGKQTELLKVALKNHDNDRELLDLQSKITRCREDETALHLRDPECLSTKCSFIVKALEAQKQCPALEVKLEHRQAALDQKKKTDHDRLTELVAELDQLRKESGRIWDAIEANEEQNRSMFKRGSGEIQTVLDERSEAERLLRALRGRKQDLQDMVPKFEKLAAKQPELAVASAKLEQIETRRAEMETERRSVGAGFQTQLTALNQRAATMDRQCAALRDEIDPEAAGRVTDLELDLKAKHRTIDMLLKNAATQASTIATLEKRRDEYEQDKSQVASLQAQRNRITNEIAEWTYLQNACGKDGLRALEIDSVAPVISGSANDLLKTTFGPNFAVRLQTQDPETMREVLDILVMREDGTEVLLDNLSGGEKVWSLKALRLALTLVAKEKSGRNFQTALSDEEDGALDVNNAKHFIALYRAFMQTGGFDTCFYITHKPECVDLADHVVSFAKGGVTIH